MIKCSWTGAIFGLALLVAAATAPAGLFGDDTKGTSTRQLARLLGTEQAFTATLVMTVKTGSGKETQAGEMQYAMRDGKMRTEISLVDTKAGQKRAEAAAEMQAMGLDRMVTLVRPDQKLTYLVYPGLSAYAAMPMKEAEQTPGPAAKVEKTELGKETIDGHPCTKSKLTFTEADGKQSEVLVWQASDLKDFPIQSQMQDGKNTVTMRFTNIKHEKPPAALFEPPADFQKYNTVQEMMMGGMQQMLQQGGK